jgi:hypothetical protein
MRLPGLFKLMLTLMFVVIAIHLFERCSAYSENPEYLPSLAIKIPNDAMKDTVLVAFIKTNEKKFNLLSHEYESVAQQLTPYLQKQDEDLTFFDRLAVLKLKADFYAISNRLMEEMEEVDVFFENKQAEGMSDSDFSLYLAIDSAFQQRFNDLNRKYPSLEKIINQ